MLAVGQTGFIGVGDTSGATINSVEFRFTSGTSVYNAFDNVSYSTFAVQPAPEPSTYAMFGLGLLALVVAARKRKLAGQEPTTA